MPRDKFDVVVMHNSINHLDEMATCVLQHDDAARSAYLTIFRRVYDCMKEGGVLVITDAGRRNLFGDLHMQSIFAPTIGWKYHQEPEVWQSLLEESCLTKVSISWIPVYPLRWLARFMSGRALAYCTSSQFRLLMTKNEEDTALRA